jgi:glycogen debranching enzyme
VGLALTETLAREPSRTEPERHEVAVVETLAGRHARTLKHGDTFSLFDASGDICPGSADGLYHLDTRHLSRFDLTINGIRPILLSSTMRDDNAALTCDLTNPELPGPKGGIHSDTLHIRRTQFLWEATLHERLRIRNFGRQAVELHLEIRFEADFADIFEVRGTVRTKRGEVRPARIEGGGVTCGYLGLDGKERITSIRFEPAPAVLEADRATFEVALEAGEASIIFIEAGASAPTEPAAPVGGRTFRRSMRSARRALRRTASRAAAVETSNEIFNEAIRRSVADIYMLNTETPQGPYPYAGVPWFSTPFGRDALITAFETLWLDPELARGVLRFLAANQAVDQNPESDAEPGKILHEVRRGEMAETGEVPFRRYYGSIDSTPLFVMLAGAYLERTGDLSTIRELWPSIGAAIGWMEQSGDRDGDGFLEYGRMTEAGLANQGWKDSHDSIFHADGRQAVGPIALAEVQGYAYAARRAAGAMAEALDEGGAARANHAAADGLRAHFDTAFWCEDIGTYALALDGAKRPCRVRASNAGHALWTGIALPERAPTVARTLMSVESFSGWGVRTVASGEALYNPMSYHNGSVWPHDNALIALGLARYGFKREAARIFDALFHASIYIELRRLPELFCGFARSRGQGPTLYPVACIPQAWAAATPIALIQAALGLTFDVAGGRVVLEEPVLPPFLDEILLRNVRLGQGSLDILVCRAGSGVTTSPLRRVGDIGLVVSC